MFRKGSEPLGDDGDGQDGLEAYCQFVVAAGHAAMTFESVDGVLHRVTQSVDRRRFAARGKEIGVGWRSRVVQSRGGEHFGIC